MITAKAYDTHAAQLFAKIKQLHDLFSAARIPYRLVGGMAVYLHVAECDPLQARLTADIDAAVRRSDLDSIIAAASQIGWTYRHAGGVDRLVEADSPKARSAVHLVTTESGYDSEAVPTTEGFLLAPVADLVRMKLTSYRLKDQVHIQDLDNVGLITEDIEASLSEPLRQRLAEVRSRE
jgi:hypothetical protein